MLWDAGLPLKAMDNITAVRAKVNRLPTYRNGIHNFDDLLGHGFHKKWTKSLLFVQRLRSMTIIQIEEMEDTFDLVMVAERWDESMVLLRNLLCWEFRFPL